MSGTMRGSDWAASPTTAASTSPASSMAVRSLPGAARSTFGGSRNSATCGSSKVTQRIRSRSTPQSSARIPRTHVAVVTEYDRMPTRRPARSPGASGPRSRL